MSVLATSARTIPLGLDKNLPRRNFVRLALVAALAMLALLAAPRQARADGCDFGDFLSGFENTVSSLSSGACGAACADGGACALSAGLAGTLGGVAAAQGQGSINNLCSQLNTAIQDASALQSWLNQLGVGADVVQSITSLGDPFSIAQCACDLEQGVGQIVGSLGGCFQQALCGLQQDLFGQGCGCTPSPPQAVDCGAIYGENSNPPPSRVDQTANGVLVTSLVDACQPQYCFCPSPMQITEQPTPQDASVGWPCQNQDFYDCTWTYACQCPTSSDPSLNTHPAAPSGPLAQVCICDQTGSAAVPPVPGPYNPAGSICPPALTGKVCPAGQVNYRNTCVAPCASSEVRTPDGACCNPTQVTSCGTCCPAGTVPNLSNGTCGPSPITQ